MPSMIIPKARRPLDATVSVPGSKSITNRALLLAVLAEGRSVLRNVLVAEDTQCMIDGLRSLGFELHLDERSSTLTIEGAGGRIPANESSIFCGNSGTTSRFLAALCCLGYGDFTLDGHRRMRQRPMKPLLEALQGLGARIEFLQEDGHLPLIIHGQGLRGGRISIDCRDSSQFVSALLMAAPRAINDVLIETTGPLPSRPYVEMTVAMMRSFGVELIEDYGQGSAKAPSRWIVPAPQAYRPQEFDIEPDASSAGYFFAAAAAVGGRVTVSGINERSMQGDIRFLGVLERMGCHVESRRDQITIERATEGTQLQGIDVDLSDMPDTAPTLACLALLAHGPTRMSGLATLRMKESDRVGALVHELRGLGAAVDVVEDTITIHPPAQFIARAINTYDDHRMAMSFAVLGLAVEGIEVNDPECVAKTYPGFFHDFLGMLSRD